MTVEEYYNGPGFYLDDDSYEAEITRHAAATLAMPLYGGSVIDIGCGTGGMFAELINCGAFEIVGVDISEKMVSEAMESVDDARISVVHTDFYKYDISGFDVAVAFNSYNHFSDPEAFVRKAHSLLVTGGRLLVAYSFGRRKTNVLSSVLPEGISRQIKKPWEELRFWDKYFLVDCMCDTDQMFILSGTAK